MDFGIGGKVAVVTGGDSGMGLAAARMLLAEGARVVLTDQDEASLQEAAASLGGEVATVAADLTQEADVGRVMQAAHDRFGPVSILVHAAGITGPTGDFLDLTDADWDTALQVDFMSAVRMCRATLPDMRSSKWGRIVLFVSEDSVQPYPEELPYCAAKAAVGNLSKGLSKAYARDGVTVNTVSPAFVATPMTDAMMEKRAKQTGTGFDAAVESFLKEERPFLELRRRGTAEEVAAAVLFLCSAQASFVVGANLRVDGGSVGTVAG